MKYQPTGQLRRCIGLTVWLLMLGTIASRGVSAQSFDCGKASTGIEDALCSNRYLEELDNRLAKAFSAAVSRAPDQQRTLLRDERHWLALRNQQCPQVVTGSRPAVVACLIRMYSERIRQLDAIPATPQMLNVPTAALQSCRTLETRYRPLADAHPGQSPLDVLWGAPDSGVERIQANGSPLGDPARDLVQWAQRQTPPVSISSELLHQLYPAPGDWTLERLPDTEFYSISTVAGTAHCYDSRYMKVERGVASLAPDPPGFGDEQSAGCGVLRAFGRIDRLPVYLEENYDWSPNMKASITVATWQGNAFLGACRLELAYSPRFTEQTLNNWGTECAGPQCPALKSAAYHLVSKVQHDPGKAHDELVARLSPAQRTEYDAALALADQSITSANTRNDPAELTAEVPLRLPYIYQDRVLLVSLGHFTIGWRYFADWAVRFESVEQGQLHSLGEFAIGMEKGLLESTAVVPVADTR